MIIIAHANPQTEEANDAGHQHLARHIEAAWNYSEQKKQTWLIDRVHAMTAKSLLDLVVLFVHLQYSTDSSGTLI